MRTEPLAILACSSLAAFGCIDLRAERIGPARVGVPHLVQLAPPDLYA